MARSNPLVLSGGMARSGLLVLSGGLARSETLVLSCQLARLLAMVLSRSLARSKLERWLDFMSMALMHHDVWCRWQFIKLMPIPDLMKVR